MSEISKRHKTRLNYERTLALCTNLMSLQKAIELALVSWIINLRKGENP